MTCSTGSTKNITAYLSVSQSILFLEAFPPPQERSVVEHVVAVRVEAPVAALPRLLVVPRHLDEALVEGEVVADGILPTLQQKIIVDENVYREETSTNPKDLAMGIHAAGV